MARDFHTHLPAPAGTALRSVPPAEAGIVRYTSLELHPWFLPEETAPFSPEFLAAAERADALGECGIDRLRGPSPESQQFWFRQLLALAEILRKPVVIHCVRALPELLSELRPYPGLRKLYHGFRGSPELLQELLNHGFHVSLHPAAAERPGIAPFLRQRNLDRIGFESDDTPGGIVPVLERAARALGLPYPELEAATDRTFHEFIGKRPDRA